MFRGPVMGNVLGQVKGEGGAPRARSKIDFHVGRGGLLQIGAKEGGWRNKRQCSLPCIAARAAAGRTAKETKLKC